MRLPFLLRAVFVGLMAASLTACDGPQSPKVAENGDGNGKGKGDGKGKGNGADNQMITRDVSVRRFRTARLTNEDADRILAEANAVLGTADGAGDVPCRLVLRRAGDVGVFNEGDGEIDSQQEFNELMGLPGNIKVVNAINWCGRQSSNVIGCAPVPGNSLAVVRFRQEGRQEGILWAHEYGHNRGLRHRDPDDNEVMNSVIDPDHEFLNEDEKDAYENDQAAVQPGPPQPAEDVKEFVRQTYIEGLPYEQATQYDAEAVPVLIEMLSDKENEEYRPNIVALLGIIGDPRAVEPLIGVIEEGEGELTPTEYAAKKSAIVFLGDLINKSKDEQALEYLVEAANDPEVWSKRVKWTSPFTDDAAERDWQLTKQTAWGLAVSGQPEAAEALRSLEQNIDDEGASNLSPAMKRVPKDVQWVVEEAQAAYEEVEKTDLRTYRTKEHEH